LLPRAVVAAAEREGRIRVHPLHAEASRAVTVFIRRKDDFLSSAMRIFIECVTDRDSAVAQVAHARA
jgi:LysR family transcriptional regulator, cell division regulator